MTTSSKNPVYFVLLGAPGAGKGTQARLLIEVLQLPQVASGDLFRTNIGRQTPLGMLAKTYIDKGLLVPDDLTIAMVQSRLAEPDCRRGAILDGFPRTLEQGMALRDGLAADGKAIKCAIYLKVSEANLIARLSGRRICRVCQATYHVLFNLSKVPGVCDICGGELYQRSDDTVETARHRLQVYFEQTMPLIRWYEDQGLLAEVEGEQSIRDVEHEMLAAIGPVESQDT